MTYKLTIEGWRFLPHSYSIINQFQCLEFLRREKIELFHQDFPYHKDTWVPHEHLFSPVEELALSNISSPAIDQLSDVTLRISYPFCLESSKSKRTYVVLNGTADDGTSVASNTNYCFYVNWNGFSVSPFTIAHNNVALALSNVGGSAVGNFNSSEVIFAYSIGTNSTSAAGNVEFILSNVVIGDADSGGVITEKEYGFIY